VSVTEQITELWDEYLECGGEPLPLLKMLIDSSWGSLNGEETEELRRFLDY
jgi:hypothetical protein